MKKLNIELNKLLLLIAAGIGALIILGTVIALITGKRPGMNMRHNDPSSIEEIKGANPNLKAFKEFGMLRTITMVDEHGNEGAVMVLTPWFSYESTDSAFYEELVSHKRLFTSVFLEYFSTKTKNALLSMGENQIKEQLLDRFNSQLTMGHINALYFDDYMFLD